MVGFFGEKGTHKKTPLYVDLSEVKEHAHPYFLVISVWFNHPEFIFQMTVKKKKKGVSRVKQKKKNGSFHRGISRSSKIFGEFSSISQKKQTESHFRLWTIFLRR